MKNFDEALKIMLDNAPAPVAEHVSIENALGRILAEDVISDINMPPFNKSAMDGYAIKREDLHKELFVLGVIKAGDIPIQKVETGQCFKIMTGAIIPEGADCVIIVEDTKILESGRIAFTGDKTKDNIAFKAEDISKGEKTLGKGTLLRPQEIAILATVGCTSPKVYRLPRVAVASTGDEIIEPHILPEGGKIRNSNAFQLLAQLRQLNIEADYMGIIEDTEKALFDFIEKVLNTYDIVLMTGGISMGDYDYVPDVLKKAGINLLIEKVAIKPGKPTIFGRKNNTFVFGMPGNPVSSFVIFELFAKPFIYKMAGHDYRPLELRLPIQNDYRVKNNSRLSWLPVSISENNEVVPVSYHGSAHIYALCFAQGIMPVHKGTSIIAKGELVNVRQI